MLDKTVVPTLRVDEDTLTLERLAIACEERVATKRHIQGEISNVQYSRLRASIVERSNYIYELSKPFLGTN